MKQIAWLFIALTFTSCANEKVLNGITYKPYGWIDVDQYKSNKVVYRASTATIVWSVLTIQTVVIPIVLTGTQLYEPVRLKADTTYYNR